MRLIDRLFRDELRDDEGAEGTISLVSPYRAVGWNLLADEELVEKPFKF